MAVGARGARRRGRRRRRRRKRRPGSGQVDPLSKRARSAWGARDERQASRGLRGWRGQAADRQGLKATCRLRTDVSAYLGGRGRGEVYWQDSSQHSWRAYILTRGWGAHCSVVQPELASAWEGGHTATECDERVDTSRVTGRFSFSPCLCTPCAASPIRRCARPCQPCIDRLCFFAMAQP